MAMVLTGGMVLMAAIRIRAAAMLGRLRLALLRLSGRRGYRGWLCSVGVFVCQGGCCGKNNGADCEDRCHRGLQREKPEMNLQGLRLP